MPDIGAGDATLAAAVLAAVISLVVALMNWRQNRKLDVIHVLVNDRLTNALKQIDNLKDQLDALKRTIQP